MTDVGGEFSLFQGIHVTIDVIDVHVTTMASRYIYSI